MKVWSGRGEIFHNWTQARSANEDITFAIANQKCTRNVKRTTKHQTRHCFLVESFAIAIPDTLHRLSFCWLSLVASLRK